MLKIESLGSPLYSTSLSETIPSNSNTSHLSSTNEPVPADITLKEEKKTIADLTKENFNLKMFLNVARQSLDKTALTGLDSFVNEKLRLSEEFNQWKTEKNELERVLVESEQAISQMSVNLESKDQLIQQQSNQLAECMEQLEQMKQKNADLVMQHGTLKGEIEGLVVAQKVKEQELNEERNRNSLLLNELSRLKDQMMHTESLSKQEIERLRLSIAEKESSYEQCIIQFAAKEKEFSETLVKERDAFKNNSDELKFIYGQIANVNESLENEKATNEKNQRIISDQNSKINDLSAKLKDSEDEIMSLRKKIQENELIISQNNTQQSDRFLDVERQYKHLLIEHDDLMIKLKISTEENENLTSELNILKRNFSNASSQLHSLKERSSELETALTEEHDQVQELSTELLNAKQVIDLFNHQKQEMDTISQKNNFQLNELQLTVNLKNEEIDLLKKENASLADEIQSHLLQIKTLANSNQKEQVAELNYQIHAYKNELSSLRNEKQSLVHQVNSDVFTVSNKENEIASLQAKIETLNNSNAKYSKELERLRSSTASQTNSSMTRSHNESEVASLRDTLQALSDEKVKIELMLDNNRELIAKIKSQLAKLFPTRSFENEESICDELSSALSTSQHSSLDSIKSILVDLEESLLSMHNTLPETPRIISISSILDNASLADVQKFVHSTITELAKSLSNTFHHLHSRISQLESSLHYNEIEHEKLLKEKSMFISACSQKIDKYRRLLQRKEMFISKALQHLEILNALPQLHLTNDEYGADTEQITISEMPTF